MTTQRERFYINKLFHSKRRILSKDDICKLFGIAPPSFISHYNYLERLNALISLGDGTNFYINNMLKSTNTPDWKKALYKINPNAVVIGDAALYEAGWLEVAPQSIEVALPCGVNNSFPEVLGLKKVTRPRKWFEQSIINLQDRLRVLSPENTLIDMMLMDKNIDKRKDIVLPGDVFMDEIRQMLPHFRASRFYFNKDKKENERIHNDNSSNIYDIISRPMR